ncbi:MAG: MlaD family protein [Crocinitomicaceae bacterium]
MKFQKEIKAGVVAVIAIVILVFGINFLKGYSFFGGDDLYHSYFENSNQLMVSSDVILNGVVIGKVISVDIFPENNPNRRVKIGFNVQNSNVKLTKGSTVEIGSPDFFTKGLILKTNPSNKNEYPKGSEIPGIKSSLDIAYQVKEYADPITQKLQSMMISVDNMVNSLSAFWDSTATSELEGSFNRIKTTIDKLGNAAEEIELFVAQERLQFSRIMSNVESITVNLKKSNDEVSQIIGNAKKISDDLVSADFKGVILDASTSIQKINALLTEVENGTGTMSKLLYDEELYLELVDSNKKLQDLVEDLTLHPERYIHFSLLGSKTKGTTLSPKEERKLRKLLDTIQE